MSRARQVVAVVALALLVVTATPALAAHTAYSVHTSAADFNAAATLENVTVEGTGDSASVEYAPQHTGRLRGRRHRRVVRGDE